MQALVLLAASGVGQQHELEYWDCSKPKHRHEVSLQSSCSYENEIRPEVKTYTIIQPRNHEIYKGYVCSVKRSTFRWHCGMFSHTMPVSVPTIEIPEELSLSQCFSMARKSQWVDHTGRTRLVNIGEELVFTVNEAGAIVDDRGTVSCEGDDIRVGGETMSKVVQLSQYKVQVTKEEFIHGHDGSLEAVYAKIRLPSECEVGNKVCYTAGKTFIFNPKESCRYHKIQQIEVSLENGLLVDHHNKLVFKSGEKRSFQDDCDNTGHFYVTEYSKLYLTNSSKEFKTVTEIDISLYVNSRSDYITYMNEMRIRNLTNEFNINLCNQNLRTQAEDRIFRVKNGEFGLYRGDILSLFQCEKKIGIISETGACYDRIPLLGGSFVHPTTRLSTNIATEVKCDTRFPLVVKTRGGLWCNIGPGISARNPPEELSTLKHQVYHHEDMSGGGLYSPAELQLWEEHVEWGDFRSGTIEKIAGGLCKGDKRCKSPAAEHHPAFTLDRLIPDTKQIDPFRGAKDFVNKWGGLASLIVLFKLLGELLISFVLISLTYFYHGFVAARTLISTIFCPTLYRHSKLKKRLNRAKQFDLTGGSYHREDTPVPHLNHFSLEQNSRRGDSVENLSEVTTHTTTNPDPDRPLIS